MFSHVPATIFEFPLVEFLTFMLNMLDTSPNEKWFEDNVISPMKKIFL
jgi:hypothetical protein